MFQIDLNRDLQEEPDLKIMFRLTLFGSVMQGL